MVGMSGKASEPRRGQSTQQKKAAAGPGGQGGGSNKTQPPPEALHVATILGDGIYPEDLPEKMAQVLGMLPSCSEEEVCIALHDHDFDTARAISALLDSDSHSSSQGEWTTKKGRRSKGGDGSADFIIAPGDSRLSGRQGGGGRGTNRAASQNTRENYGGSVSVGSEGGRGRGAKGRAGSSGRGRSTSNRREKEEKDGKREERPRAERVERGARTRNRGPRGARARARQAAAESERTGEEARVVEEKTLPVAAETWDDLDPQPSTEWEDHHHHKTGSPARPSPLEPLVAVEQTWDSEAESKGSQTLFPEAFSDPTVSETSLRAGFPLPALPTASSAQTTSALAATNPPVIFQSTPGSLPHQSTPGSLPRRPPPGSLSRQAAPVEFQTTSSSLTSAHSSRLHSRHKRLARSQIPSQPVEMPKGSFPEMSELGIAFGGLELSTSREPTIASPSSSQPQDGLLTTPTSNEARYQSDSVTSAVIAFSTQFTEDSGVISIATTAANSYGGSVKKLEAPPGLPHPMAHTSTVSSLSAGGSLPHSVVPSGSLPHSVVPSGSVPHSVVPSGSLPHSVVPSGSLPHSVVPSGTLPHPVASSGGGSLPHTATLAHAVPLTTTPESVVSTSGPLPPTTAAPQTVGGVANLLPPEPISLPPPSLLSSMEPASEHSKSTFTTAPSSSQLLAQSFPTSSSTTGATVVGVSELLSSQTMPTSSVMATPTSKTLTAQSSHHHGNQQQLQAGLQGGSKHTSLQQQQQQQQQAMIYPYMLQPPLVMPMSAYYDPEMSRYPASVSMAYYQHPTSSDPAMATGMGRDHAGSGFTAEGASGGSGSGKFGGRGSDISTSATPPHSQQQGVQQNQMSHAALFNPYYGGNVIYPMYHGYGMPGFSHSIPKPSGGSSYPGGGVNSYQAPSGAGFGYDEVGSGQDFKVYGGMSSGGLGKPHPLSSSGPDLPSGSAYKQHTGFDSSKTSYSTYSVPQGGYGFIPTGPMPLQMPPSYMAGHEGGGGGRSQKHSNKQYSGSHGSSQLWSQQPGH